MGGVARETDICQYCREVRERDMLVHLRHCPAFSPEDIESGPTFIQIAKKGKICKICFTLFPEEEWVNHRKGRKRIGNSTQCNIVRIPSRSLPENQQSIQNTLIPTRSHEPYERNFITRNN